MQYKIKEVKIVLGRELKDYWEGDMFKITIDNKKGFLIDTINGVDWKLFEGKTIEGFYIKESAGFDWIQANSINDIKVIEATSDPRVITDETSNYLFKSFRKLFPANYRTDDGHYVRSRGELIIDNWLYNNNIVHAYEKKLPILEDVYSDFFIPSIKGSEPIYIEYWGLENDENYIERKEIKKTIYTKYNFKLIELNNSHIENIDDLLPNLLLKYKLKID